MSANELFSEIGAANHWRVEIRPETYVPERFAHLSTCWDAVTHAQVKLRGWYYPHIQGDYHLIGENFVQSGFPKPGEAQEVWRLYQSGQFIHYFRIREDYYEVPWASSRYPGTGKPAQFLEVVSLIYSLTEIFEFAARLAAKNLIGSAIHISVSAKGLKGRDLIFFEGRRLLFEQNTCQFDELAYDRDFPASQIVGAAGTNALDATRWFLERFGWLAPPMHVLEQDQLRLLERRD